MAANAILNFRHENICGMVQDMKSYDVFPRKDVACVSYVDTASHLGQIPG